MKRNFKLFVMLAATGAVTFMSSCTSEDDLLNDLTPQKETPDTRASVDGNYLVVNFDDPYFASQMAGPTSYGANLYDGYTSTAGYNRFKTSIDRQADLNFGLNADGYGGTYNYWNGGMAISNWNYMSNPSGQSGEWWYSYQNQCSVYNTGSTDGVNKSAGHSGSNFGVVYGYTDTFSGFIACASMNFTGTQEKIIDHLFICNSSYGYGVIKYGNSFTQGSLESKKGWFKLIVKGYKSGSTTPVATDEIYLADYRNGANNCISQWTNFNLTNIKKQAVNKITFDFEGSDSGAYGLNTPAYVCIDDINILNN